MDSSTVAESMQKGRDSLECPPLQCQLNIYGQIRGRLEDSIRVPATTPTSMAAPPPPYDRVLMDDGSAEPSTSAAAYTFYISKKHAVNDFHGSKLNMDGRNFYQVCIHFFL
jgi:hypothetical protein